MNAKIEELLTLVERIVIEDKTIHVLIKEQWFTAKLEEGDTYEDGFDYVVTSLKDRHVIHNQGSV